MKNVSTTATLILKHPQRITHIGTFCKICSVNSPLNLTFQGEAQKPEGLLGYIPLTKYDFTTCHFHSPLRTGNFQRGHDAQCNNK